MAGEPGLHEGDAGRAEVSWRENANNWRARASANPVDGYVFRACASSCPEPGGLPPRVSYRLPPWVGYSCAGPWDTYLAINRHPRSGLDCRYRPFDIPRRLHVGLCDLVIRRNVNATCSTDGRSN